VELLVVVDHISHSSLLPTERKAGKEVLRLQQRKGKEKVVIRFLFWKEISNQQSLDTWIGEFFQTK
jgi:hypothetical protein